MSEEAMTCRLVIWSNWIIIFGNGHHGGMHSVVTEERDGLNYPGRCSRDRWQVVMLR